MWHHRHQMINPTPCIHIGISFELFLWVMMTFSFMVPRMNLTRKFLHILLHLRVLRWSPQTFLSVSTLSNHATFMLIMMFPFSYFGLMFNSFNTFTTVFSGFSFLWMMFLGFLPVIRLWFDLLNFFWLMVARFFYLMTYFYFTAVFWGGNWCEGYVESNHGEVVVTFAEVSVVFVIVRIIENCYPSK